MWLEFGGLFERGTCLRDKPGIGRCELVTRTVVCDHGWSDLQCIFAKVILCRRDSSSLFLVFNRGSAATRCHKCDLEGVNCGIITIAVVHMCNVLWPYGLESRRPFRFARLWLLALAFLHKRSIGRSYFRYIKYMRVWHSGRFRWCLAS